MATVENLRDVMDGCNGDVEVVVEAVGRFRMGFVVESIARESVQTHKSFNGAEPGEGPARLVLRIKPVEDRWSR